MATYSTILDWKIPWAEEPSGLQSVGSQRAVHDRACMHAQKSQSVKIVPCLQAYPSMFLYFLNNLCFSSVFLPRNSKFFGDITSLIHPAWSGGWWGGVGTLTHASRAGGFGGGKSGKGRERNFRARKDKQWYFPPEPHSGTKITLPRTILS